MTDWPRHAGVMEGLARLQSAAIRAAIDALDRGQTKVARDFLQKVLTTVEPQLLPPAHQRPEVKRLFETIIGSGR